jgi:hypothetical protein
VRRQPDFSTTPRPSRAPAWDQLALVVGVAALALSASGAWRAREEARAARARLDDVRREVEAVSGRLRGAESRARADGPLLAAADAPPSRIVAAIASALPGDARLEGLRIDYQRGGALEMTVVARDAAAWDALLDRLEREPCFREVEPGPEAREAEVRSVVRARWVGGAR